MVDAVISASTLSSVAKHALQWLLNLNRASKERKAKSLAAIDKMIAATRRTANYSAARADGQRHLNEEAELASQWTQLSQELELLGIRKLAKRCDIKGRYWSNREKFAEEWLDQADITLESVERLARRLKAEIKAAH